MSSAIEYKCKRCHNSNKFSTETIKWCRLTICDACCNIVAIHPLSAPLSEIDESQSALGRVSVVKKQVTLGDIVEKPVRSDLRPTKKKNIKAKEETPSPEVSLMDEGPNVSMFEGVGASAELSRAVIQATAQRRKPLEAVLVVHQDERFRSQLVEQLKAQGIAQKILDFEDNAKLTSAFSALLLSKRLPSLVLLDATLEGLDSLEVGFALRAIESAFKAKKHAPLLLLTPGPADDAMRAQMKQIGGARNLEIDAEKHAQRSISRVVSILSKLISAKSSKPK